MSVLGNGMETVTLPSDGCKAYEDLNLDQVFYEGYELCGESPERGWGAQTYESSSCQLNPSPRIVRWLEISSMKFCFKVVDDLYSPDTIWKAHLT